MMIEEPVDLSTIDPDRDPGAADRFVSAVMSRIEAHDRPARADALIGIGMLVRPLLAAASVVLAAVLAGSFRTSAPERPRTVAEAVGIPPEFLGRIATRSGDAR